ncbi:hypothetical protein U9M48_006161 [Paspalum notatum var. saurae]|uniref:Uncharacterized protein n=1 Tax=Paspalum notatum var. saurae TaxID=547442 RepID=A0AAQ3PNW2_PASNO
MDGPLVREVLGIDRSVSPAPAAANAQHNCSISQLQHNYSFVADGRGVAVQPAHEPRVGSQHKDPKLRCAGEGDTDSETSGAVASVGVALPLPHSSPRPRGSRAKGDWVSRRRKFPPTAEPNEFCGGRREASAGRGPAGKEGARIAWSGDGSRAPTGNAAAALISQICPAARCLAGIQSRKQASWTWPRGRSAMAGRTGRGGISGLLFASESAEDGAD